MTFIGLLTASMLGGFQRKCFPIKYLLAMAASFVGYNALSLANLNVNTVSFYQISKILVTPTVMVVQFFLFGKSTSMQVKVCVVIMSIGVALATVSELQLGLSIFG